MLAGAILIGSQRVSENVKVDLRGLERYGEVIRRDLASPGGSGPIRGVFRLWAARWRTFQKLRFVKFSRGGGNWKPLAASTIKQRRKGKKKSSKTTILWDKFGSMIKALTPSFSQQPGQLEKPLVGGIRVGFGGPSKHPGGAATIADIASFHDEGTAILPARRILGDVDGATQTGMRRDMEAACIKLAKATQVV